MTTTTEQLAEWVCALEPSAVPEAAWEAAERCLLDHLACAIGGASFEAGDVARRYVERQGARGPCTLIGSPLRVSARDAVFANAAMANSLDFDDTLHGHPGATVFPAALAASEEVDAGGEQFLLAAVVGYEVSVRCMSRFTPLLPRYQAAWDLGALQAYGAAAAAARALGASPAVLANAWGIVSGTAPMPHPRKERDRRIGVRSMLKSSYGWSAASGVMAVQLSFAGMEGPAGAFDGALGLWSAEMAPSGEPMLLEGLGESFVIDQVEHKPHMACRFIHPVIDALEKAIDGQWPAAADVEHIRVESHALLADEHHTIYRPGSPTEAQFSVPHVVAVLVARAGVLDQSAYIRATLDDEGVRDLCDRVRVDVDPAFDAAFPDSPGARVTVTLTDGRTCSGQVRVPRGGRDHPMTSDELRHKFDRVVGPLLGQESEKLAAAVHDVRSLATVRSLVPPPPSVPTRPGAASVRT